MNQQQLKAMLPWTERFPLLLSYAGSFTRQKWQAISDAGLERFFNEFNDQFYIPLMMQAIQMMPQMFAAEGFSLVFSDDPGDNEILYKDAVFYKLQESAQAMRTHPAGNPVTVLNWLGDTVLNLLEPELTSYGAKDDLIQWLSSKETREILAGNSSSIASSNDLPAEILQLGGKDIRTLLINNQITPKYFLKLIKQLTNPVTRNLPGWVGDMSDNKRVASHFTDEQLDLISSHFEIASINHDEAQINAILRFVSLKMQEAASTSVIDRNSFNAFLEQTVAEFNRSSAVLLDNLDSKVEEVEVQQHENGTSTLIRRHNAVVTDTEEEIAESIITPADNQQPPAMPRIPTKAFMLAAVIMAVRAGVAWNSCENNSFIFRCMQSLLQLNGSANVVADITSSALIGLGSIFVCAKRGLQAILDPETVEDSSVRRSNIS